MPDGNLRMRWRRIAALGLVSTTAVLAWNALAEKRVAVVEPGRILRGAWPNSAPLLRLIRRESIRTVVTLTAINRDDPKYVAMAAALRGTGIEWRIIPMRGSTATLAQMAEAADLVSDSSAQPVFFHCVGGHHRSNLVHAAYLIRAKGYTAQEAWDAVCRLPWTRPDAASDRRDRCKIDEFAALEAARCQTTDRGSP